MVERIDNETPEIIKELFKCPYIFFPSWLRYNYDHVSHSIADIGCGKLYNQIDAPIVYRFDKEEAEGIITTDLPRGLRTFQRTVNTVFCFEFIEHIPRPEQYILLDELNKMSEQYIVIGSINRIGPNFIDGVEIFKGDRNPFHQKELTFDDFINLFQIAGLLKYEIFPFYSTFVGRSIIKYGINYEKAISNYFVIKKY